MRLRAKAALVCVLLAPVGCWRGSRVPEQAMPPNTITLSQMMRELSSRPGFTEQLLAQIEGAKAGGKRGAALLTPALADELRKRILGKDWEGLDRFPGWTMREINPTVQVMGKVAGGAAASTIQQYLDLGPYALDRAQTISLDEPSPLPGFSTEGIVTPLGDGVVRGDGPSELAPEHAESQRLADVMNRLAANALDGPSPARAELRGRSASSPQNLVAALLASGHQVMVIDARYFANFGHLHSNGHDVMMPFCINTRVAIPGTGGPFDIGARPLLVPVSHAEYEWQIRGPLINADVSYYFGIDGKSEWRVMDTLDQAWVLKRAAHTYTGAQAVEVTRLAGLLTVAYMHQHIARPDLPFGGYYALGVCQDGVSAIEHKMTGKVTLFPNTADTALFNDPRDAEVNALLEAIPKDRGGAPPEPERIFGSLPTDPEPDGSFSAITIQGFADDLRVSYAAWQRGRLHRTHKVTPYLLALGVVIAGAAVALLRIRRHRDA